MNSSQTCFCGSTLSFENCCQPLINRNKLAQTPEQLMRSRFSAYATKAYQYVFDSYAKQSQSELSVTQIQSSDESSHWFALLIYPNTDHSSNMANAYDKEQEQFVEFSAFYIADNSVIEMREKSRFILETVDEAINDNTSSSKSSNTRNNKQWRYIDGDIISHCQLEKVTRNQICPCNSYSTAWTSSSKNKKAKKYKHCCGNKG